MSVLWEANTGAENSSGENSLVLGTNPAPKTINFNKDESDKMLKWHTLYKKCL